MGLFDFLKDDEDEQQPAAAEVGPPKSAMTPQVREYLLSKQAGPVGPSVENASLDAQYGRAAADTAEIDEARKSADSGNRVASVLQGLSTMFAGRQKTDGGFYDGIRSANNSAVSEAKEAHKSKLADLLTKDKLQRQDVERKQDDTKFAQGTAKFGWDEANNDPSKMTPGARLVFAKSLGVDPRHLDGLSFDQAKQLKAASEKSKQEGGQLKAVETDKGIEWYVFNPNSMSMAPTGLMTGYKLGIDGVTGTKNSGADKNAPAIPIMSQDGTPLSEVRTGLEGERAYVKGTAGQQVKDEQAVQVADAGEAKFDEMEKRWLGMHAGASKEGPVGNTGPVAGKVATGLSEFGVSMGPKTDQFVKESKREAASYIRDISGLSSTDQEFQRLMNNMPKLGTDPEVFKASMAAWRQEVRDTAVRRRREAGMPAKDAKSAPVEQKPAKVLTPEQDATVKAYEEKYKGARTRDEIIKALGY